MVPVRNRAVRGNFKADHAEAYSKSPGCSPEGASLIEKSYPIRARNPPIINGVLHYLSEHLNTWSVENKNHWRRDATRWREDRSVRRKPKGAKNLALLRGAILALIPQEKFASLNAAFDHYTEHRTEAIRLLTQTAPLQCP